MTTTTGTLNDVHLHVSAAVLSLADVILHAQPTEIAELVRIGRLLTQAQRRLQRATKTGR